MTVKDIRATMHSALKTTIISLYRKDDGLLFKAPAKSPVFYVAHWANAEVLDIDFSIADCIDYDVEMELIIK